MTEPYFCCRVYSRYGYHSNSILVLDYMEKNCYPRPSTWYPPKTSCTFFVARFFRNLSMQASTKFYFSFWTMIGSLGIQLQEVRLHLTKNEDRNNCDKSWKKANSDFYGRSRFRRVDVSYSPQSLVFTRTDTKNDETLLQGTFWHFNISLWHNKRFFHEVSALRQYLKIRLRALPSLSPAFFSRLHWPRAQYRLPSWVDFQ